MAKFVLMENCYSIEKISEYIKKAQNQKFYVTPKLMGCFLESFWVKPVIGLEFDDIRIAAHKNIDILCSYVHNKVFQKELYRVDGVKIDGKLTRTPKTFLYDEVLFGIEEDIEIFNIKDFETI